MGQMIEMYQLKNQVWANTSCLLSAFLGGLWTKSDRCLEIKARGGWAFLFHQLNQTRGHQPFWNCELLLVHRLMRRATSLIHASDIQNLLNLPSTIVVLIFVNVKTLIMLMLFLEQARGWLDARWHHVGYPWIKL